MIVVVGQPLFRATDQGTPAGGLPSRIALAAAAHGRSVQLVGKAGEDAEGDAVVLALARGGVGHVALLRESGRVTRRAPDRRAPESIPDDDTWTTLEAADVDLALRYLSEFAVLVLADPAAPDIVRVVTDGAGWAGAWLVVVVGQGQTAPDGLPPDAIVFEAPGADPDGVFASLVGSFAAALDDGDDPARAFRASIQIDGWTASPDS